MSCAEELVLLDQSSVIAQNNRVGVGDASRNVNVTLAPMPLISVYTAGKTAIGRLRLRVAAPLAARLDAKVLLFGTGATPQRPAHLATCAIDTPANGPA